MNSIAQSCSKQGWNRNTTSKRKKNGEDIYHDVSQRYRSWTETEAYNRNLSSLNNQGENLNYFDCQHDHPARDKTSKEKPLQLRLSDHWDNSRFPESWRRRKTVGPCLTQFSQLIRPSHGRNWSHTRISRPPLTRPTYSWNPYDLFNLILTESDADRLRQGVGATGWLLLFLFPLWPRSLLFLFLTIKCLLRWPMKNRIVPWPIGIARAWALALTTL